MPSILCWYLHNVPVVFSSIQNVLLLLCKYGSVCLVYYPGIYVVCWWCSVVYKMYDFFSQLPGLGSDAHLPAPRCGGLSQVLLAGVQASRLSCQLSTGRPWPAQFLKNNAF